MILTKHPVLINQKFEICQNEAQKKKKKKKKEILFFTLIQWSML